MQRTLLLVVASSAIGFRASAQEAGERSPVTVTGTVVSEATGEPIAGVIVVAEGLGLTFVTDAQGRFVFDEVPRGVYEIGLVHKDHERLEGNLTIDQPGAFRLAMTPTDGPGAGLMTGIVGVVTDQVSGEPVSDVVVNVPDAGRTARTGAEGRFSIVDLVPGRHEIRFSHLGYAERSESIEVQVGRVTRVRVVLDVNAIALNPIEVTVDRRDATLEERGFYQREEDGWGHFVDREDLAIFIDGVRMVGLYDVGQDPLEGIGRGGYSINDMVDPAVVAGIELYRGAAGIPPQYWGTGSSCGVVLIWLRRGDSGREE